MNIDIFSIFPKHDDFYPVENGATADPEEAIYNLRTRLFSGFFKAIFMKSSLGVLIYRGRPLIAIYQSEKDIKFGKEAVESAQETHGREQPNVEYMTAHIDTEILSCFSSLLSRYPIFRNFSPDMLVIDELFNKMVYDTFSGCILISTRIDHVLLYIKNGEILETKNGKIINSYPINESPVIEDMAKAVSLMSQPDAALDIYEVPENLYSDLASWQYGIPFSTPTSIDLLKDSLIDIARDELRGKSNFLIEKLAEIGTELADIEDFCVNLENNLDIQLSKRAIRKLSDEMMTKIIEFKQEQNH